MIDLTCSVAECNKPSRTSGLCSGHYERKRLGKPVDGPLALKNQHDVCVVDGCESVNPIARGMCERHYCRWRAHGDATVTLRDRTVTRPRGLTAREAFYYKPPVFDENGCWIWQCGLNAYGYGQLRADGRMRSAHTVSYELHVGEIPKGMEIDHACRVRACVNPQHLRLVTHAENAENLGVRSDNGTGVRGVRLLHTGKYRATVTKDRVKRYDKCFDSLAEAEAAVTAAHQVLGVP